MTREPSHGRSPAIIAASAESIARAASLIGQGVPVAVPTETVYGLAANARDAAAVARVYAAKGRPAFNPLIVHVSSLAEAERIAQFRPRARDLAERFWPGPLTMILPLREDSGIASLVTAGLETVAIRVPAHPVMRALLEAAGVPLAAPSANRSGAISPTSAAHVAKSLGDRVELILDGGNCANGIKSTIVRITDERIELLRPGPITAVDLGIVEGSSKGKTTSANRPDAPGQLASHYAPVKPLRLNVAEAREGEWLIGFGKVAGDDTLSEDGSLQEAASRLFDALHRAEDSDAEAIAVASIPMEGLGAAINDRLRRAAS